MATITTGHNAPTGFTSGEVVTATKLNNHVNSATVTGIVNADIDANAAIAITKLANPQYTGFRNRIINGDFRLAQRGTSFTSGANNDDTYNLDRWYVLSDGNDSVDITQTTSEVPTNGYAAIALDVETVNKKFGIAQIIEQQNCIGLIGGSVTISFKAKVSSTTKLDNIKAAIVAWSGTADTVTSDIVSAWGAEGTNPTLIANATYENTPANLNVTTSYATYTLTANVDTASTKNIIVFIWSDVTDTTLGDFLYITDVQLEAGTVATPFEARPIGTELALCQRYFQRFGGDNVWQNFAMMSAWNTTNAGGHLVFPVKMRVAPQMSFSAANTFDQVGHASPSAITAIDTSTHGTTVYTTDTGLTQYQAFGLRANNTLNAFIEASAEL